MPFPSARLALLALIAIAIVSPFVATASDGPDAIEIPIDADILITDGRGVIVGAGAAVDGATFRLALVEGFSGAATLIFVLDDGSFQEIEVTIGEGGVSIGGSRLDDLVAGAFAHVAIERQTPGSRPLAEASGPDGTVHDGTVHDGTVDDGPSAVPPIASPPAVSSPSGARAGEDGPGPAAQPGPPVETGPPDDEDGRESPATEPPSSDPPAGDPPAGEPPRVEPSAGEGPSEPSDDARDRGRP